MCRYGRSTGQRAAGRRLLVGSAPPASPSGRVGCRLANYLQTAGSDSGRQVPESRLERLGMGPPQNHCLPPDAASCRTGHGRSSPPSDTTYDQVRTPKWVSFANRFAAATATVQDAFHSLAGPTDREAEPRTPEHSGSGRCASCAVRREPPLGGPIEWLAGASQAARIGPARHAQGPSGTTSEPGPDCVRNCARRVVRPSRSGR